MKKTKFSPSNFLTLFAVLVFGVVLLCFVNAALTRLALEETAELKDRTVDFLKARITEYENNLTNDKTKSLIRLLDKATELAMDVNFKEGSGQLERYAYQQRLTGIIILDENLKPVFETSSDGSTHDTWNDIITDNNVAQIAEYPRSAYMVRITRADNEYDFAAVARRDAPGVVICYVLKDEVTDGVNDITPDTMFDGMIFKRNGVVMISDGKKIIASNNGTLKGKSSNAADAGKAHAVKTAVGNMVRAKWNGEDWYGGTKHIGNYTLFAYFPAREIFYTRSAVMTIIIAAYIVLCMLVLMLKIVTDRKNIRIELQHREELENSMLQAQRANIAKTDFLRRMSHDVRTPINAINGMLDIEERYPNDPEKHKECHVKIRRASNFLLDLVNSVLDMNKLESGEIKLSAEPFRLDELLDSVNEIARLQASESGVEFINLGINVKHFDLIGSPVHLRQIFQNLTSNAVKYNRVGGFVKVSCNEISNDGESAVFEFVCEDNGIGMSSQFQKHAFEPFAQENSSIRTAYYGTGLGLPIVKELTESMGGRIELSSKQGEGTRFAVTIPLKINKNAVTANKTDDYEGTLDKMKILIAEDNEINMEITDFLLREAGAEVTKACDGAEAVELFKKSEPDYFDLILMDIMMPVMDGLEAVRRIRELKRSDAKTVLVFAMSANAFTDDIERSLAAGMDDHISKPVDMALLSRRVTEALEKRKTVKNK